MGVPIVRGPVEDMYFTATATCVYYNTIVVSGEVLLSV